jgi:hypothetical protein
VSAAGLWAQAAALAEDLAGAPSEAHATIAALLIGALVLLAWGVCAELQASASARRRYPAARISRARCTAAGLRRRYRLP